jgi:uncharacterized protein YegL
MQLEEDPDRRLPVYLVLDTSESMVGDPIAALNQGVGGIVGELRSDPMALETVWLSVITFAGRAQQVVPLMDIVKFSAPPLRVRPGTALGAALSLLETCLAREVRLNAPERKGDWRPMIFLLSDGDPTDAWEQPAKQWRDFQAVHRANVIAVACGEGANVEILKQIADTVVVMRTTEAQDFRRFFGWVSASTRRLSVDAAGGARGGNAVLPPLPDGVVAMTRGNAPADMRQRLQRQLFLASRCGGSQKPYLMRYRLVDGGERYEAVKAHQVDEDYFSEPGEASSMQTINTSKLQGAPACPYCGHTYWYYDVAKAMAFCSPPFEYGPGDLNVRQG